MWVSALRLPTMAARIRQTRSFHAVCLPLVDRLRLMDVRKEQPDQHPRAASISTTAPSSLLWSSRSISIHGRH